MGDVGEQGVGVRHNGVNRNYSLINNLEVLDKAIGLVRIFDGSWDRSVVGGFGGF